MTIDQTSLPEPKHENQPLAMLAQDQKNGKEGEEDFLLQVVGHARQEWEAFHRQHPDVDEETFCQAQRFCVKQWVLQRGRRLFDLEAFERAHMHFAGEVLERAAEIEVIMLMMKDPIYQQARSLSIHIAAQALQRSSQLREAIGELSREKAPYLVGKVNQLRAPGQAQDRGKEAQERVNMLRQDSEALKQLGITIAYENEKKKLKEREKDVLEQLTSAGHFVRESQRQAEAAADVTTFEAHLKDFDTLIEALHLKTLATYRMQEAAETVPSDWDVATQRAKHAHDQLKTFGGFVGGIQAAITDALTKAKAERKHAKSTHHYLEKVNASLERIRKRSVEREQWAQKEINKVEKRKKQMEKLKGIYMNMMIQARNDLFGNKALFALRSDTPGRPSSGYQRVYIRIIALNDVIADKEANDAADEAELEHIYQQGKRRAEAPPDPTRPGTGAGLDAFRCAERFVQAKAIKKIIQNEEQLRDAIAKASSMTTKALELFENIGTTLNEIQVYQMSIAQRQVKCAKSLEKVKEALQRAAHVAQRSAKEAKQAADQQTRAKALPDRRTEATHAQEQARRTAQQERAAYSQAKTSLGYAIRSAQEIAAEHRNVQEQSKMVEKYFTALLQGHLPYEKEVLDCAITGVKNIVKASLNAIRQEEQAQAAAHQTAKVLETAGDGSLSRLITSEQEALLLAALANDTLAQCIVSYRIFHKLAADIPKDYLQTMKDQWQECLEMVNTYLDEIKPEKERQDMQRQKVTSKAPSNAQLLIDEQTGLLTLKDGVAAFSLQDLAGIAETDSQEHPGQSKLVFKAGLPWSSYDVPHDQLHERCEKSTRIHLQAPDGAGGHVAMLYLPNGTQINVADIDFGETEHDPARPERGITITLKKDRSKINLLAAACVMRGLLKPEALRDFVDKSLDKNINQIRNAVGTKKLEAIQEAFEDAKIDDRNRKYLARYLLSSEKAEKRVQDHMEWIENVVSAAEQVVYRLREYGDEALKDENGDREIDDVVVLEHVLLDNMHDELYQKRDACLQKIARGKGLNTIINSQFFGNPDDTSTATNLSVNIQEVLVEYERVKAWLLAAQQQDPAASGPSENGRSYLLQLRRAILDEAPAYFRTILLVSQIKEAVETENWEEGTQNDPGVTRLVQELTTGPSAIDRPDSEGNNDYGRALQVFTQQVVTGIQDAVKTADPGEIVSRTTILDFVFGVVEYAEARIEDALSRTTPTEVARLIVKEIGSGKSPEIKDHTMSDHKMRRQR